MLVLVAHRGHRDDHAGIFQYAGECVVDDG
jgi:hypothetical protein